MTRPFDDYPNSGSEAYDRLGTRLQIQLVPVPEQINLGEEITLRFTLVFDGNPLGTLDNWPSEDDCEDLQSHLISQNHYVAEVGYSGPQPQEYYNVSGRAFLENNQTYSRTFGTDALQPGTYRFTIVAVANVFHNGRSISAARRLDIETRLLGQVVQNPSFWVIEHINQAWARQGKTGFNRIESGSIQAQNKTMVLPMMLRAPNNLLIPERVFDFDETTGDIYTVHVPVPQTIDQEIRRINANGDAEVFGPIPGIDSKRILTLAVDGTRRQLWLALPNALVAISLDNFTVISNRPGVIAPTIAIDPLSGELWAGAHRRTNPGQATYGLKRYGLQGEPSIDLKSVVVTGNSHLSGMLPLNDGSLIVVGNLNRVTKYIRISHNGEIHSSSDALTEPILQFGVNPENGQIWEIIMVQSRIATVRHRDANFSTLHQFGLTDFGFANLFGIDYIPALNAAVVTGNARFARPPFFRGQLATISKKGTIKKIPFTGSQMAIVKSIR